MRPTLRIARAALALAAVLGAALATPAAAVDAPDYVVWRFLPSGARAVGLIHDGSSSTMLLAETVGLTPNASYRYVGSSAGCGYGHQAANTVWSRDFRANAKGAAYLDAAGGERLTPGLRSIRLFQGASQVDCAKPIAYRSGDGGLADAIALLTPSGTRLKVYFDLGSRSDKLTVAGHGFLASHGYRLVGASVACPAQPTASTTLFEKTGRTDSRGILWRHDTGSNLANEPPRSIQLFSPSGRVACVTPTKLPSS
jgi:hypothetical protein